MKLSVVVPMLDEEHAIAAALQALRRGAPEAEVIIVDGGSTDRSVELARPLCDVMITTEQGRSRQMNAGVARASGDAIVFVHADTIVPATFGDDIARALDDERVVGGRFDIFLDDSSPLCVLIGKLISLRSRISQTGTGDQAIFVRRDVFTRMGGFPDFPVCEDLDFTRRLRRFGKIACLRSKVMTSARRWRRGGLLATVLRMWTIRALYLLGSHPCASRGCTRTSARRSRRSSSIPRRRCIRSNAVRWRSASRRDLRDPRGPKS